MGTTPANWEEKVAGDNVDYTDVDTVAVGNVR